MLSFQSETLEQIVNSRENKQQTTYMGFLYLGLIRYYYTVY